MGLRDWRSMAGELTPVVASSLAAFLTAGTFGPLCVSGRWTQCGTEQKHFWDLLASAKQAACGRRPNATVVLCIDGNARVGSIRGTGIGRRQPEKENDNGSRFRHWQPFNSMWAVSTFADAGHTWTSAKLTKHRIKYLCLCHGVQADSKPATTSSSIGLPTTAKDDHNTLMVGFFATQWLGFVDMAEDKCVINKLHFKDPKKVEQFQQGLANSTVLQLGSPDELLEDRANVIKNVALHAFGPPKGQPRQPSISSGAWAVLKYAALMRRWAHKWLDFRKQAALAAAYYACRSVLHTPFNPAEAPITEVLVGKKQGGGRQRRSSPIFVLFSLERSMSLKLHTSFLHPSSGFAVASL